MEGLTNICWREKEEGLNYVRDYWHEERQEETRKYGRIRKNGIETLVLDKERYIQEK